MSWYLILGSFGMLILAISIVIFVIIYQRRMYEKQRRIGKLELTNQQKLIEAEIKATEREQKRIAQDLHDDTGASLTSLRFFISQLDDTIPQKAMISETLSETSFKVKNVCNDLLPYALEELGLSRAISQMANRINRNSSIEVNFVDLTNSEFTMSKDEELALYRIVQELLNNIVKYASASYVDILLTFANKELNIEIVDDGTGVIPEMNSKMSSFGLKNIVSRLQYIDGQMTRTARRQRGTIVTIRKTIK